MKVSGISDEAFIRAAADSSSASPYVPCLDWRAVCTVRETLERQMGVPVPGKVFVAKGRQLAGKGKIFGCTNCQCLGRS